MSAAAGRAGRLLDELLATAPRVEPRLAARLAATARGRNRESWRLRRTAALMLEHLFWISTTPDEEALVLAQLGANIDAATLRKRVARNARVHDALRSSSDEFVRLSECDSRVTFAPWLFTTDEVVDRIDASMRASRAVIQSIPDVPEIESEARLTLARLPAWEREIVMSVAQTSRVLWMPVKRDESLGDLLAFPPETVVATVHPPGSDLEIEIKRTGRSTRRPLAVVWERNGAPVPPSHRLDGGSTWDLLRFEAISSARFAVVWRAIHGDEAPISRTIAVKAAYGLPDGSRELPVLEYFKQEARRDCMRNVVRAFCEENDNDAPRLEDEMSLASRFLLHASPAQSIVVGTSALRLDKVAAMLANANGNLADLLDEILVLFDAPKRMSLDAVFAIPSNRARADAYRRNAAKRLGALWGTFLALGISSSGESLVNRNVGLKAVFRDGEWTVELISMDHDNLRIALRGDMKLDIDELLEANWKDEIALFGGMYKGARVAGSLELLDEIYRAHDPAETRTEFFASARAAFARSVAATEPGGAAAKLFSRKFLDELRRWRSHLRRHKTAWLGER